MDELKELSLDDLNALAVEKNEAIQALFALDAPTDEQVAEAEGLATEIEAIEAEQGTRAEAAQVTADKFNALKEKFTAGPEDEDEDAENPDADEEGDEEVAEGEQPTEAAVEDEEEEEEEKPKKAAASTKAKSSVKTLAKKSKRPPAPQVDAPKKVSITAAADVPEIPTGSPLSDIDAVGVALVNRVKGFPTPHGTEGAGLQKFGVASFRLEFPEELTIKGHSEDLEVLSRAAREDRLSSDQGAGSLVAAGGWCAPSETLYDLCEGETLDGILSVPEVNVARGGIRYTSGPQFADFYGEGFTQTEAQAIAGDTKDCYEIVCPPFTEVRMDAVGLCIKVPILTNAAYPELTRRVVSGSMVAHQHRVNASVITRMEALSGGGVARVITGLGSTVSDTLEALELVADQRRQKYRLGIGSALEVVVPFWVKGAMRSDLARRQGVAAEAISDTQITAHFAARNLAVSFVYDWQVLDETVEVYPATYNVLIYPAGTFIKGTTDVINLSAVYDAASLAVNVYTGVFFEQGLLVAKMCYDSDLVTLPICNAGRTGAADLTCVVTP